MIHPWTEKQYEDELEKLLHVTHVQRQAGEDAAREIARLKAQLQDLRRHQDDMDRASVLPLRTDDGTVTVCDSISGGQDEAEGMPARLHLLRRFPSGSLVGSEYRAVGVPFRQGSDVWVQAVELATTAVPDMEITPYDPLGMMQRVVNEVENLRARLEEVSK